MFRKILIVLLIVVFSIDCVFLPQAGAYNLLPPLESSDKTGQGILNTLKVNPWTGVLTFQEEDILVKDLIFPVRLTRTYRSDLTDTESGFGPGWSWSFGMRLLIAGKGLVLMDETGNEYLFQANPQGLYVCPDLPGHHIQKKNRGFIRIMPLGIEQSFDDSGRLVSVNDPRNSRISIERDREKVVRVSNNLGKGIKLVWSGNYISEVQDLTGRRVRYQYDSHQRLSHVTRPDGTRVGYSYDSASRLMQILYPDNRSAEIDYRGNSYRVSGLTSGLMFISYVSDGNRNIIRYAEDEKWTFETLNNGNLRKMTGPWGGKWEFRFDNGRLVSFVNPYGGITKYSYDNSGLLLSQTDPLGRTTRYVYHKKWLVPAEVHYPAGEVERFVYDDYALLTGISDKAGRRGDYTYYPNGLIKSIKALDGSRTSYIYNSQSLLESLTNGIGGASYFAYDNRGNIKRMTDPLGNAIEIEYNDAGNPLRISSNNVNHLSVNYDPSGTPVKVHMAGFPQNQLFYDASRNIYMAATPDGGASTYKRDAAGRITEVVVPGRGLNTFVYRNGSVTEARDSAGNIWNYSYDKAGRLTSVKDPDGNTVTFTYDISGRLIEKKYSDGEKRSFKYDQSDRIIEAAVRDAKVSIRYDAAGRPISEQISGMPSVKAAYLKEGRDYALMIGGTEVGYEHDADGRLLKVSVSEGGPSCTFSYDKGGNVTALNRSNGVNSHFTYDKTGRILSIIHKKDNEIITGRNYSWNQENLVSEIEKLPSKTRDRLKYDGDTRLTSVTGDEELEVSYGPGGTRRQVKKGKDVTETYRYNEAWRMLDTGKMQFEYDRTGNRKVTKNISGQITYAYNADGKLISVKAPQNKETKYAYDALGRRISVSKNNRTERLVYFGGNIVATADDNGAIKRIFVPTVALDFPLFAKIDNEWYAYHQDINASILALTDKNGRQVESYQYSYFGIPQKKPVLSNPFGFAGMWLDEETGLYYSRARDYDPETGSFIQPDPFPGYLARPDSQMLYAFASNNPVTNRDPEGEFIIPLIIAGAVIGAVVTGIIVAPFVKSVKQRSDATNSAVNEGDVSDKTADQYDKANKNISLTAKAAVKGKEFVDATGGPVEYPAGKASEYIANKAFGNKDDDDGSGQPKSNAPITGQKTQETKDKPEQAKTKSPDRPKSPDKPVRIKDGSDTASSGQKQKPPQLPAEYNPLDDPNVKTKGGTRKPVDTAQVDKLGGDFQQGSKGGGSRGDTDSQQDPQQPPQVIQQPGTYTSPGSGGRDDTSGTDKEQTPGGPGYPPYGPPRDDRGQKGTDWTKWATQPSRDDKQKDTKPKGEKPPPPGKTSPPGQTPPPATGKGIDITVVGTAPPGKCIIVQGQLVPVQGYKENIAGMTVTLTGPANQSTTSSGSGGFSFNRLLKN